VKGDLTLKILERIAEAAVDTTTLFFSIMVSGYGASRGRIERNQEEIGEFLAAQFREVRERERFSKLVSKLKREGLVAAEGKRLKGLTRKGRTALRRLKARMATLLPVAAAYPQEKRSSLKVIIFDVPEKERRKRDWLRATLGHLGFSKLQKSVWVGKQGLPKEFIEDMRMLKLVSCVEIFEVGRTGSLEKII
jgi:DNA-binding transcriptional regulator PaaX